MTEYRTHGYDIVIELSEDAIEKTPLATLLPLILSGCPSSFLNVPTDEGPVSGNCSFMPVSDEGAIDFETPVHNGVHLNIPFSLTASFSRPANWPGSGTFNGEIRVTPVVVVRDGGNLRRVVLDFSNMTADSVLITRLALPPEWARHELAVRQWIEYMVRECLVNRGEIDTLIHIPVDPGNNGDDPFTPIDVDVRVVATGTESCIALLLPTSPNTPRYPENFTECTVGPGEECVIMLGNRLILHRVMGQNIIRTLEIPDPDNPNELAEVDDVFDFTGIQTTLRESRSLNHLFSEWWLREFELVDLNLSVTEEERIELNAHFRAIGFRDAFTSDIYIEGWGVVEGVVDNVVFFHVHIEEPEVDLSINPLT